MVKVVNQTEELGYNDYCFYVNGEGNLLINYLKPDQVVIDVGANTGEWGEVALKIQPKISLICFEPVPTIYQELLKRLEPYTDQLYEYGLSDREGTGLFYFYEENWQIGGLYDREANRDFPVKKIDVKLTTLDAFCTAHNIDNIDFLKIDTEGSEFSVLKGAKNLLQENRIKAVQFECGSTYSDGPGVRVKEVMQLLAQAGYVIFRIFSEGLVHISRWEDELENNNYCNYFAIVPSMTPNHGVMANLSEFFPKQIDLANVGQWPQALQLGFCAFNTSVDMSHFIWFFKNQFKIEIAVETGTNYGATAAFLSSIFKEVHTIEASEKYYNHAQRILSDLSNVHAYLGSSDELLKTILPTISSKRTLFYLDAHWEKYWPLLNELEEIGKTHRDNCAIVIDDVRVPQRTDIGYDEYDGKVCSYEYVKDHLNQVFSEYSFHYIIPCVLNTRAKLIVYPKYWNELFA
jgi:FkbM family methyltransferase